MAIRVVQLGSRRRPGEGLRIGTVRYPPRGVRKDRWAELDYFDVWLPQLAPSSELIRAFRSRLETPKGWKSFAARYRAELTRGDNLKLLGLLSRLSAAADFSVGCYCAEEARCHRSILRDALKEQGARIK